MKKLALRLLTFFLTFSFGSHLPRWERNSSSSIVQEASPQFEQPTEAPTATLSPDRPADYLIEDSEFRSGSFSLLKKLRYNPESRHEDEYFVIEHGKKSRKLDVVGGPGVQAQFGYFSFLHPNKSELFISQDTFRGGCQWVLDPNDGFRMIFDGEKFDVGREGYDLSVEDLDHDGTKEILVPFVNFYDFQDKMSMSQIPLPDIIFKYDTSKREYLPANHKFKNASVDPKQLEPDGDDFAIRSRTLRLMGQLIFAGERDEAWRIFERHYKLQDKSEMRRRIKAILHPHPVYKYIYKNN